MKTVRPRDSIRREQPDPDVKNSISHFIAHAYYIGNFPDWKSAPGPD